jgi:UDP-N-acetylmuramoyl-L-alanyl-D-glutamate--2,6-diaminopimelate ligase
LIDYAHTEQSLKSVLQALQVQNTTYKEQNEKPTIIIVFGATGDRDTTKRPKMGAVVHELADIIVLTDDDTYTESSERIITMVRK